MNYQSKQRRLKVVVKTLSYLHRKRAVSLKCIVVLAIARRKECRGNLLLSKKTIRTTTALLSVLNEHRTIIGKVPSPEVARRQKNILSHKTTSEV